MTTYISLMRMTPKGRQDIAGSLERGGIVRSKLAPLGVTMTDYHMTIGAYDCIMFFDAPNEVAMMQALMEIGRLGAVETRTLTAIAKDDYASILSALAAAPE